ncbi:pentapeptide repeat-containing protein [Streptomyces griseoincarnatus]
MGCRGILITGHTACFAHLADNDRRTYLASLCPGRNIDLRGTPFTTELLDQLLAALRDPTTGRPHIGDAGFGGASFTGDAVFRRALFTGTAGFGRASFTGPAKFGGAHFSHQAGFQGASFASFAEFNGATFTNAASFGGASFTGTAGFERASFTGPAKFSRASFTGPVKFSRASFTGPALFNKATFTGDGLFSKASFRGPAKFGGASFSGTAIFREATFTKYAGFAGVSFSRDAEFSGASFTSGAEFSRAAFTGYAGFRETSFMDDARFDKVSFSGTAGFRNTSFSSNAEFRGAHFTNYAGFQGVMFACDALFNGARFTMTPQLGPLLCGQQMVLDGAVFEQPVTVQIAARQVSCSRTKWANTATLHLRYAELDLRDAIFEYPVVVSARPDHFSTPDGALSEAKLSGHSSGVRLVSAGGVDAAHLALHDIDLSLCRFASTVHLDQLRVDGWCTFATTPVGWNWSFPWRWSRRNTLAEEHHWRFHNGHDPSGASRWTAPPEDASELKPAAVAALYRQVRKSLEDGKNEPDAADFYYGECEMRRHDATRPWGERALLTAYWALSGYGLRAIRALSWLGVAMAVTFAVMMLWGLPAHDPTPTTTGRQVGVGQKVVLTTDTPDAVNPSGSLAERVTTARAEKALRVVINSVIFRSSDQDLTTAGTYTEMASRLSEPVLLGLAVLAVRSRIKR